MNTGPPSLQTGLWTTVSTGSNHGNWVGQRGSVQYSDYEQHQGITTQHWKDQTLQEVCANRTCQVKFTLFTRCHHCRRCGEVFCAECLKYQRRLNFLAHPDPNGRLHKVCKSCYDKGPQTIGQSRNWKPFYRTCKGQGHTRPHVPIVNQNGVRISNFRESVNIQNECTRLREGFESSLQKSGFARTLSNFLPQTSTPEWQKSIFHIYGKMAITCSVCETTFTLTHSKRICVICGSAVCRGGENGCSTTDLLVYIPDGSSQDLPLQAELKIVKIVGCPPVEPKLSEYLAVCGRCRQTLEDQQVAEFLQQRESLETSVTEDDFWTQFKDIDCKLRGIEGKIDVQMPKYQELIDTLEVVGERKVHNTGPKPDYKSNTQVLAKAQSDLGDHLTTVAMTIQTLRTLKPSTPGQVTLLKNFLKAKCAFYHENMYTYRDLKRKLETVTPAEMLTFIQATVDKNAINSCYIAIKQLAMESLHLCTKHQLDMEIVTQLVTMETVVEKALMRSLAVAGDEWEKHNQCVNELIGQNLTSGKHRLVRISNRRLQKYGKSYVLKVLTDRATHTLKRVHVELSTKCADKSFVDTKEKVKVTVEKLSQGDEDWIKL